MFYLTPCGNAAILYFTGLASQNIGVKIRRFNAVFLRAFFTPSYYGWVDKALARVAGPMSGTPTLFILPPMIGVFVGRFSICNIGHSIMKSKIPGHQSAQQNQRSNSVSLFNLFLHRKLIASSITGTKALRIKCRQPAVIVKFAGFEGGV